MSLTFANFESANRKRLLKTFALLPADYDLTWIADVGAASVFVDLTLTPTPDGATLIFTVTTSEPTEFGADSILLRNGVAQLYGTHYTLAGDTITFIAPYYPLADDYFQLISSN